MSSDLVKESALSDARLNNIAISVADLDRSVAWFERVLRFVCTSRGAFPDLEARVAFMRGAGTALELVQVPKAHRLAAIDVAPPDHLGPTGYKAIVFDVGNLVEATVELKSLGVEVVWETRLLDPVSGLTSTLIRDPDGNLINFFQRQS
jgi:catechol 2,3-dioxygenase-like lactoylglutathione lyase family enzyme